jgi:hypothetical protein
MAGVGPRKAIASRRVVPWFAACGAKPAGQGRNSIGPPPLHGGDTDPLAFRYSHGGTHLPGPRVPGVGELEPAGGQRNRPDGSAAHKNRITHLCGLFVCGPYPSWHKYALPRYPLFCQLPWQVPKHAGGSCGNQAVRGYWLRRLHPAQLVTNSLDLTYCIRCVDGVYYDVLFPSVQTTRTRRYRSCRTLAPGDR